jgi:hypothetical protein
LSYSNRKHARKSGTNRTTQVEISNLLRLSFSGRVNYERTPASTGRVFRGQVNRALGRQDFGAKFAKFPVFFPVSREFGPRERFARDSIHRHVVRAVWLCLAYIEENPADWAISPSFFHLRFPVAAGIRRENRRFLWSVHRRSGSYCGSTASSRVEASCLVVFGPVMEIPGTRSQPVEQMIDERNEDYPTFETEKVIRLQLRYSLEGVAPTVAPNGPFGISTLTCLPLRRITNVLE